MKEKVNNEGKKTRCKWKKETKKRAKWERYRLGKKEESEKKGEIVKREKRGQKAGKGA